MPKHSTLVAIAALCLLAVNSSASDEAPGFATGIKIGEVTESQAIVWVRLTENETRAAWDAPMPEILYRDADTGEVFRRQRGHPDADPVVSFPDSTTIDTIQGAAPGAVGEVRISYRPESESEWVTTKWRAVNPKQDFTRQVTLGNLTSATDYQLRVQGRRNKSGDTREITGQFRTAPDPTSEAPVQFTVSTGQRYSQRDLQQDGFKLYAAMSALSPDFFVHTGDIVYYDDFAKSLPLARWHWARTYSFPTNIAFHRNVSSYFIKDDHDTWMNDCWPGMESRFMGNFTFEQGLGVFREQVPMGKKTYRTFRWGKDLQVWMVEGRDYRSPNDMPDGPTKTIWGKKQKEWFKRTVQESDATFRVLLSPMPLVGPDRNNKRDNHSNRVFEHEGNELRSFIAAQKNMVVICGDRHWQYVSVDRKTGLREYSCGPASDEHAGGWKQEDVRPEHEFLNVAGGFLGVTVERKNGVPQLIARHYDVDGNIVHEDVRIAE